MRRPEELSTDRAAQISAALSGHKVASGWMASCPAHDDRTPSLAIRVFEDRVLVHCHAGCPQSKVIDALRTLGLWNGHRCGRGQQRQIKRAARPDTHGEERSAIALSIWQAAVPASGTLVETYFAGRRLKLPLSPAIRFHRALKHPTGGYWPCLVALVSRGEDAAPVAIHRTFLARDGAGKAPVKPEKMMLGPCRGGVVRLAEPTEILMVGEGIETCLAAMQATGHPAWAALSTSGLRTLNLPSGVRHIIVLADGDDAGETAARECARRLASQGRRVGIARPPRGMDFNDMMLDLLSEIEGVAK